MSPASEDEQRRVQGREPRPGSEPVADPAESAVATADEDPEESDADGASRTRSPTAPASSGKPVADHRGELDPEHAPDLRPRDSQGAGRPDSKDETSVRDPSASKASRTGSAGTASAMAGSGGTADDPEPNPRRGEAEMDEEKPEDWGE